MQIFIHHIYELKKGLRNLVLCTMGAGYLDEVIKKLKNEEIDHVIHVISSERMNVYFGDPHCVEIIRRINKRILSHYTDEEDFILGILLGYDSVKQCRRFLNRKDRSEKSITATG